ncbi:MAG: hypothetical protein R3B07_32135 [Polyangiaceae bacterium]
MTTSTEPQGVVIPFPAAPPPPDDPAPSLEELAEQAGCYLADLRPVFDRPAVRRGLRRLIRDLHPNWTSWGRSLRTLAPIWAAMLAKDPVKTQGFVRAVLKAEMARVAGRLTARKQ